MASPTVIRMPNSFCAPAKRALCGAREREIGECEREREREREKERGCERREGM